MYIPYILQAVLISKVVKACEDFHGSRRDDLSFSSMDRLTIVGLTNDHMWVRARNDNGEEGRIPLDCVCLLQEVSMGTLANE